MNRTGIAWRWSFFLVIASGAATFAAQAAATSPLWGKPVEWAQKAPQFFAAPDGKTDNQGTRNSPWDLASAFSGANAAKIAPGSVLWLRGGIYPGCFHCELKGTEQSPIIVRAFPGERVTLDCPPAASVSDSCFYAAGSYVWYWGFELEQSEKDLAKRCGGGISIKRGGDHQNFINLFLHDIGNSSLGGPTLTYGNIFYNIGVDNTALSHPIYPQNNDLTNPNRIVDNIIFNSYGFGIHAYATGGYIRGFVIEGNVLFNAGLAHTKGDRKDNLLIAAKAHPIGGIVLKENMGWTPKPEDRSVNLGRYDKAAEDIVLTGNYFKGETRFSNRFVSTKMEGNTFYPAPTGQIDIAKFPNNTYLKEAPKEAKIFVRPNIYEPKRAHIVVYNWPLSDTVSLDLKGILEPGDPFEVRNAQNPFAKPVAAGIYDGKPVVLPMSGLEPFMPLGPGKIEPSEMTGREFNVFLLLGGASGFGGAGSR